MDLFNLNSILQDNNLLEEVISKLVTKQVNTLLTLLLSEAEIYNAMFTLKKDIIAGSNGFGLCPIKLCDRLSERML